jgi:hypothetical protein
MDILKSFETHSCVTAYDVQAYRRSKSQFRFSYILGILAPTNYQKILEKILSV